MNWFKAEIFVEIDELGLDDHDEAMDIINDALWQKPEINDVIIDSVHQQHPEIKRK